MAQDAQELQERMQEMERVTSLYTRLACTSFDECHKLAKLYAINPTALYKYIAIADRECKQPGALVQIIEAPMVDPLTGLARDSTPLGLSGLGQHQAENRAKDQV